MSNMEIFIIICACLIPIVALVILFPKIRLKKKEKKVKTEPKQTEIEKYVPETKIVEEPKIQTKNEDIKYDPSEFKDYLKQKKSKIDTPTKKELPDDFIDFSSRFTRDNNLRMQKSTKKDSIASEIKSLSPELKALLLSGALDKKDFDEE